MIMSRAKIDNDFYVSYHLNANTRSYGRGMAREIRFNIWPGTKKGKGKRIAASLLALCKRPLDSGK